ncbi:MAG: sugar transferase [bacterium]|nr:sugar transferase [bacterium]
MESKNNIYQNHGKRVFDFTLSAVIVILLSPLFLIIAILIKKTSRGSIIFTQKRTGKNGKSFTLYKFRTMVPNAESLKKKYQHLNEADGPVFKIKNDPRFTKIGKILSISGLDELPQLFNTLKGEMSLVGPRPLPIAEEAKINQKYQNKRRKVKPGIVSLWTMNGASHSSFQSWVESDMDYIKRCSLKIDLSIIVGTLLMLVGVKSTINKHLMGPTSPLEGKKETF